MAFVTARASGRFELRESVRTATGPRSRTLATFTRLTPDVVERARARARRPLDDDAVRRSARRAGASVEDSAANAAAARLLAEIGNGGTLRPVLTRLLRAAIGSPEAATDAERAAGAWLGRSLAERGLALRDLLDLTDHLPPAKRGTALGYPSLEARRD